MQTLGGGENARALYGAQQFRVSRRSVLPSQPVEENAKDAALSVGRSRRKTGAGIVTTTSRTWAEESAPAALEDAEAALPDTDTGTKANGAAGETTHELWSSPSSVSGDAMSPTAIGVSLSGNASSETPMPPRATSPDILTSPGLVPLIAKELSSHEPRNQVYNEVVSDLDRLPSTNELDPYLIGWLTSAVDKSGNALPSENTAASLALPANGPANELSSEEKTRTALLPPLLPPGTTVYRAPDFSAAADPQSPYAASAYGTVTVGKAHNLGPSGPEAPSVASAGEASDQSHVPLPLRPLPTQLQLLADGSAFQLSGSTGAIPPIQGLMLPRPGSVKGGFSLSASASSAFCLGFGAALKRLRATVSKKKRRFQEGGFDLDLTYVTPRIIAMGFPSSGGERLYRNPLPQVQRFFESRHPGHYRIYNLCSERAYDPSEFCGRVARYAFDDHNPCPLELIPAFCSDVHAWLGAHPDNVAAIHCKAGKGRTGLMIAAYLLHAGVRRTAEACLRYFGVKRTKDMQGVTIPSQMRYVHYYERMLTCGAPPVHTYRLRWIRLRTVPNVEQDKGGGCTPYFTISNMNCHSVSLAAQPSASHGSATAAFESELAQPAMMKPAGEGDGAEGWCGTGGKVIFDWRVGQAAVSDLLGRQGTDVTSAAYLPSSSGATSTAAPPTAALGSAPVFFSPPVHSGRSTASSSITAQQSVFTGAGPDSDSRETHVAGEAPSSHNPSLTRGPAFTVTNASLTQPLSLRRYKAHEPFVDFDCSLFDVRVAGNTKLTLYHEKGSLLARAKGAVKGAKGLSSASTAKRRNRSASSASLSVALSRQAEDQASSEASPTSSLSGREVAGFRGAAPEGDDGEPPEAVLADGPSATMQASTSRPSSTLCHLWFHTAFIARDYLYFPKHVVDKACKDKKGTFSPHFAIELYFERLPL